MQSTTADEVSDALIAMMRRHRDKVLTMTADNGKEFTRHEEFGRILGADVSFAHPNCSWERGTNENTNGLVRQYFPKGTTLLDVGDQAVHEASDKLNNRPWKVLGWKSPREAFFGLCLTIFPKPT